MTSHCIAQAGLPQPSSWIGGVHHCTWMVCFCLCALSAMRLPCFPRCVEPAGSPGLSSPTEAFQSLSGVQSDRTVGGGGQQGHRTSLRTKDAWILVAAPSKPAGSSAPGGGYCVHLSRVSTLLHYQKISRFLTFNKWFYLTASSVLCSCVAVLCGCSAVLCSSLLKSAFCSLS